MLNIEPPYFGFSILEKIFLYYSVKFHRSPPIVPNTTPGINIWTNLNLQYMRMLPYTCKIHFSDQTVFQKKF